MKLNNIKPPLFETETKKLTPAAFPMMISVLSDSSLKRFELQLAKMRQFLDAGELIKSEFQELKYLNNYIGESVNRIIAAPFWHGGAYKNLPEHIQYDLDYSNIAMHTIPGKLKKAEAFQKKGDHEVLQKYIALMKEMLPLHEAQKKLKSMIVAKRSADVQKIESKKKFTVNIMAHEDVKRVRTVLIEVTTGLRNKVLAANYQNVLRIINRFMEQYDPNNHTTTNYKQNGRNPFVRDIINKVTTEKYREPVTLKEDYKKIAQDIATRQTDDILEHFILKQTTKLAGILVKKDNMTSVKLENAYTGSGIIEGMLRLDFADGSSFDVNNKIVWTISKLGKPFYRFPTTFHNVKLSNGKVMSGRASEQRMNTEFTKNR